MTPTARIKPVIENRMAYSTEDYLALAIPEIKSIMNQLEKAYDDGFIEMDYADGVLQIEIEGKGVFVINKHDASQQIWVSSPVSGAYRFSFIDNKWTAKDEEFKSLVMQEIKGLAGID